MSNEEETFQRFVDSVRFDDRPGAAHRDRLEQELLAAYDRQEPAAYEPEPMAIYLRKMAVAAGFLVVCGLSFWAADTLWLKNPDLTYRPDPQVVKRILEAEDPTGAEKKDLLAQINHVWQLILQQDTNGLVSTVRSQETPPAVRQWAAENLGDIGDANTLQTLEASIEQQQVTDPADPLKVAADEIRQRLENE